MQLYLLRKNELRMTSLPTRVNGQYSVEYTADNGCVLPLIRINARNNKWIIAENSNIQISGSGRNKAGDFFEYELTENTLYYLRKDNK